MRNRPDELYGSPPFSSILEEDSVHSMHAHQEKEYDERSHLDAAALVWVPRSGKSKSVIDSAFRAAKRGELDALIITAPNGPHENWVRRELPTHAWSTVPYRAMSWSTSLGARMRPKDRYTSKRWLFDAEEWQAAFERMLRSNDFQIFTVNHESAHLVQVQDQLKRFCVRKGLKLGAVFDEAHAFRRPGSKWTTAARRIAKTARWRRILTATPWSERPLQAYSEYGLLDPKARGSLGCETFEVFKNRYCVQEEELNRRTGGRYLSVKEWINLEELGERVAPWSSFVQREDIVAMPPVAWRECYTSMSSSQVEAYTQLREQYRLELPKVRYDIVEGGARLTRLQQVLSGFVRDEQRRTVWIDRDAPRYYDALDEVLTADAPTIVWCAFREEAERLSELIRNAGGTALEYHGGTPERLRQRARDLLHPACTEKLNLPFALVSTASSGAGSGLNLSRASRFVWFGHTKEQIVREQASERCTMIGGGTVEGVDMRCPDTVDDYVLDELLPGKRERAAHVLEAALRYGDSWVAKRSGKA